MSKMEKTNEFLGADRLILRSHQTPERNPLHQARALVGAGNVAQIDLDGQIYTLRITRAGKLILTK